MTIITHVNMEKDIERRSQAVNIGYRVGGRESQKRER